MFIEKVGMLIESTAAAPSELASPPAGSDTTRVHSSRPRLSLPTTTRTLAPTVGMAPSTARLWKNNCSPPPMSTKPNPLSGKYLRTRAAVLSPTLALLPPWPPRRDEPPGAGKMWPIGSPAALRAAYASIAVHHTSGVRP